MNPKRPEMKEPSQDPEKNPVSESGLPNSPPGCCGPSTTGVDCCAPPSTSSNRGKLAVFLLVTVAALAVLIYGLFFRGENSATDASAEAPVLLGDAAFGVTSSRPAGAALGCGVGMASITAVSVPEGHDVLFVLLPGEDPERTRAVAQVVDASIERIRQQGKTAATRTIQKGDESFAELIAQCSVSSFPCVTALGKGCGWTTVTEEITESKILQAFVIATQTPSACSGASACCPMGSK